MFNKLISEIEALGEGTTLEIEIEVDENGFLDRQCPAEGCGQLFKIKLEDWESKVQEGAVFCAICGHESESGDWHTQEQTEFLQEVALAHLQGRLDDAILEDTRRFNQKNTSGFITMSMAYKPGARPVVIPVAAVEELRQEFSCEQCDCRYSALGAAFFCPACGHNSVENMFEQSLRATRKTVECTETIETAVAGEFDPDTARITVREIVENALGSLVSSFESYTEARFAAQPEAAGIEIRGNAFQNPDRASALFKQIVKIGYEDILQETEYSEFKLLFQRRHVLAHRDGIVDQQYIDNSGDSTYAIGQRLVIDPRSVLRLAHLMSMLARELNRHLK